MLTPLNPLRFVQLQQRQGEKMGGCYVFEQLAKYSLLNFQGVIYRLNSGQYYE
jgi:hypothetical protein